MRVDDIDSAFQHAVEAGATVLMPVQKMFWGDRYGRSRPVGVMGDEHTDAGQLTSLRARAAARPQCRAGETGLK
jgi:hypothetical protein